MTWRTDVPWRIDALSWRSEGLPWRNETLLRRNNALPWRNDALLWRDDALPWRNDALPWRDNASPWRDDAPPWRDDALPWRREVMTKRDKDSFISPHFHSFPNWSATKSNHFKCDERSRESAPMTRITQPSTCPPTRLYRRLQMPTSKLLQSKRACINHVTFEVFNV